MQLAGNLVEELEIIVSKVQILLVVTIAEARKTNTPCLLFRA